MTVCQDLADWAHALVPTEEDVALAQWALVDTVAVTLAARTHPLAAVAAGMATGRAGRP